MYSILILGGASLAGRNLVNYLVENKLAERIRVVDRVLIETGYFSPRCLKNLKEVEYIQANLYNSGNLKRTFETEGWVWDIVVNCGLEAKSSQPKEVYEERIVNLSINIANEVASRGIKVLVHISNSQIYTPKKAPSTEKDDLVAVHNFSKYFIKAEEAIKKIPNLNVVILRPAILYGPGDMQYLTPLLVLARVYQYLKEPMPLLWKKEFKLNSIHAWDLARAIHHCGKWYITNNKSGVEIFNVVDEGNTESSKIQALVSDIFNVQIETCNSLILGFIKSNIDQFLEDVNEKHIEPWSELLKEHGIYNSPLIPYMDKDNLDLGPVWMDGSKIKNITNFKLTTPSVTSELLVEVIEEFRSMNLWPGTVNP